MIGWGKLAWLFTAATIVVSACGGRTGALDDDFSLGGSGAGGRAGSTSRGGSVNTGGAVTVGGVSNVAGGSSGGRFTGGSSIAGAVGTGGAGAVGTGGASSGGATPGGSCCEAQVSNSCQPSSVAQCVCQVRPSCCDKVWDESCAQLVEQRGCGNCGGLSCEGCLAASCSAEVSSCFQDFGCVSIFSCVQATGCQGFACYQRRYCRDVIDEWGGPAGDSMSALLDLFGCAIQSACPCN